MLDGPAVPDPKRMEVEMKRASVGSIPMRVVVSLVGRNDRMLLDNGVYASLSERVTPYTEANRFFSEKG